jgi:phosphatidylglycerol:prolipoprotein diacylglycerol transferase
MREFIRQQLVAGGVGMLRHLFGLETYAIVQVATIPLFATLAVVLFRRSAIRLRHAVALTFLYVLCNFLAAKILYDFVKAGGRHTLFDHPSLDHFLEGGYWGWPVAFLPAVLAYPLVIRVPVIPFYRAVAFLLPPVLAAQKVACFTAGCCFGCETALPWAVVFPEDSVCETPGVPVHPLQVYDALLPLAILGVLLVVDYRAGEGARPFLLPVMVGLYALTRFATEFLRPRGTGQSLLLSQWLELGAVVGVLLILLLGRGPWRRLVQAGTAPGPAGERHAA